MEAVCQGLACPYGKRSDLCATLSSEEFYRYRCDILGCRRRGRKDDRAFPFDHKTGKGYVAARVGTYHDALFKIKRAWSARVVGSEAPAEPLGGGGLGSWARGRGPHV